MHRSPRTVAVVGAGVLGLSTAWFLQERGVEVTVYDAVGPAAGASWGNAGWITPTLSTPLPEPSMLAHGLRQFLRPTSPLYIPPTFDPGLWAFLTRFARNSTAARWRAGVTKLVGVNRQALDAFDALAAGGVEGTAEAADPFIFGYTDAGQAQAMLAEGRKISQLGLAVELDDLPVEKARELAPMLSEKIRCTLRLGGQRYLNPPAFVAALAEGVRRRGGQLINGVTVTDVVDRGARTAVLGAGLDDQFDTVVLATGATLPELAGPFGVRVPMRAGRGYSFAVDADAVPPGPVYFPGSSVVCTPLDGRIRIAGMMEFAPHGAPLDPRRITAIVESVRPLVCGLDLANRTDEWVGSRPCTADGLPLVGATRSPRVYVAGGHAMEGMTLGPVTSRLLAESVCTGATPAALAGFDPLR